MSDVSILGAGRMGTAIARCLLRNGRRVAVWNRSAARASSLVEYGAVVVPTAQDALEASPVTLCLLSDTSALRQALGHAGAVPAESSRLLINLSTGTPEEATAVGDWIEAHGLRYLAGSLSGHPHDVGSERMRLYVAGSELVWTQHEDMLRLLAPQARHLGSNLAKPTVMSLAASGAFFIPAISAFVEAAAFAAAHGVPVEEFGDMMPRYLERLGAEIPALVRAIAAEDFDTDQASLGIFAGAVEKVVQAMGSLGQPGRMAHASLDGMRPALDSGLGESSPAVQYLDLLREDK